MFTQPRQSRARGGRAHQAGHVLIAVVAGTLLAAAMTTGIAGAASPTTSHTNAGCTGQSSHLALRSSATIPCANIGAGMASTAQIGNTYGDVSCSDYNWILISGGEDPVSCYDDPYLNPYYDPNSCWYDPYSCYDPFAFGYYGGAAGHGRRASHPPAGQHVL